MRDDLIQEAQVGRDPAHTKLPQCPVHARDRLLGRRGPGRDLDQQRIVGARDHGAGVGRARVQSHAEAGRAAIGGNAAVVGNEIVVWILGRDPALQGVRAQANLALRRHIAARLTDALTVSDAKLRLDQVDAGRALGHRVFDLDARIDLDEIQGAAVGILQEFDRTGVAVVRGATDSQCQLAQRGALGVAEKSGRRALDNFLIAPLHRAVALVQMHQIAMRIAQDLHLDVTRATHELLQVQLIVAEGCFGLASRHRQQFGELGIALDHAHAASAPAPARLEHDRVADLVRQARAFGEIQRQWRGRRHDGHARGQGQITRRDLVAQLPHAGRARADENDAGGRALLRKFRVFGQKAIARMDRIDVAFARYAQDFRDIEIGLDRPLAFADQIGLVGFGSVQTKAIFLRIDRHRAYAELSRCDWRSAAGESW